MLIGSRTPRLATALPLALRGAIVAAHLEDGVITERRVARLRRAGLRVVAWTVNDSQRAAALEAMGVEWVITDQPARILGELGEERVA
jgi:glycerophosphoryl diester phosphodiesterase